jgi:cystathionine beta-lyase/cystathionine gamma-synthase
MNMQFSTLAVWGGQDPDPQTGAVISPIYPTSTYARADLDEHRTFEYSRTGNPNRAALEKCLAMLEHGSQAFLFASGVAATHAALSLLKPGDHIISPDDIYGGTFRLLDQVLATAGIGISYVDASDLQEVAAAFRPTTRMVWLETPTNPLLKIFDIAALAELSHRKGALLAVDNTFATPYFQNPLDLGADIVVHSTTKYINGHSDVIGGCVIIAIEEHAGAMRFQQNALGAVPSPFDVWLTQRGLKTLPLRMQQHEKNAVAVADFLNSHPRCESVFFPGLKTHKNYEVACRQMSGFGGMVSFRIAGGREEVNQFVRKLSLFSLADSLGGVESLVNYSTLMTHGSFPQALKDKIGITSNLVRLSVGIEDIEDLLYDLRQALA